MGQQHKRDRQQRADGKQGTGKARQHTRAKRRDPNRMPPSKYSTPVSEYMFARTGRLVAPADPLAIVSQSSTNVGVSVAKAGRMKASAKVKAAVSTRNRLHAR
jgi:hypothetical protein